MEILNRLTTPTDQIEEISRLPYPCQFCGEMFNNDEAILEFRANLALPPVNAAKRHVHAACILEAARIINEKELDRNTFEHLHDLDEVDSFLDE